MRQVWELTLLLEPMDGPAELVPETLRERREAPVPPVHLAQAHSVSRVQRGPMLPTEDRQDSSAPGDWLAAGILSELPRDRRVRQDEAPHWGW